jgi:hypothetical protein
MSYLENRSPRLADTSPPGARVPRRSIQIIFSGLRTLGVCTLACIVGWKTHSQTPVQLPSPLPEASVEMQRPALTKRVAAFVQGLTKNPGFGDQESLVRWNAPLCFQALGFGEKDGETVAARLGQVASAAGAPLERRPCRANFVIIASTEPDRVLAAWYAQNNQLFGDTPLSQIDDFLNGSKAPPIRVWRNIDRGRVATTRFGHFVPSNTNAESSAFVRNAILGFHSVFAVIDTGRTGNLELNQVSDYVAMTGLSNVDRDADFGAAASILRIFSSPAEAPPALTAWDAAFLRALYQSDQTSRSQRSEIAERMVRELSR